VNRERIFSQTQLLLSLAAFALLCTLMQWQAGKIKVHPEKHSIQIGRHAATSVHQKVIVKPIFLRHAVRTEIRRTNACLTDHSKICNWLKDFKRPSSRMLRYMQYFASGLHEDFWRHTA
jgi:hypothetical protein